MRTTRPTLKDVAELSGASLRTVKKVMSGDHSVKDKTRQAVLQAATELHYTRNRAATALARNKVLHIAVVYSQTTDAYFPEVEAGFKNALRDFGDYGLDLEFCLTHKTGSEAQRVILESILHRDDIEGVILQPFSTKHLNDAIDALVDAGKPVVTFGADAPHSKRLCYVGPDAYKSGRIGGQILANYIGKQGKVFVINQGDNHMATRERSRGFLDRIHEHYPNIDAFEMNLPENSNLYYDMVLSVMENEKISGIFCTDANTVLAGRVLHDLHEKNVSVVGFDISKNSIELMRDGYIKVIIETKPEITSFQAAKIMYEYLIDRIIPQEINYTPIYIMTSECFYGEA